MKPVKVITKPRVLPRLWDRSVLFFANLTSMFFGNKGGTRDLQDHVDGLDTYGGRLVPIFRLLYRGEDSALVLEREPQPDLLEYFEKRLGLSLPRTLSTPGPMETLIDTENRQAREFQSEIRKSKAAWLDGFVTDPTLVQLASLTGKSTLSTEQGSRHGNNKLLLHQHLESRGLPVFDTSIVSTPEEVPARARELSTLGYSSAVVKAQIGASGVGLLKIDVFEPREIPKYFFHEGPCLVQGWLGNEVDGVETIGSPSVQLFLSDDAVHLFDLTDQILGVDSVHEGNRSPPDFGPETESIETELFSQAAITGRWLHDQGYRGTASTDFLVVRKRGVVIVIVCEINARVTGATYPALLARHFLPGDAWVLRNLRFHEALDGKDLLARLDEAGCLFKPGTSTGVLPINFNLDRDGRVNKGQFLFLDPEAAGCFKLLERVSQLLLPSGRYDRD